MLDSFWSSDQPFISWSATDRLAPSRSWGRPTSIQMPSSWYPWTLPPSPMITGTRSLEKSKKLFSGTRERTSLFST